jgi:hypothetical protein
MLSFLDGRKKKVVSCLVREDFCLFDDDEKMLLLFSEVSDEAAVSINYHLVFPSYLIKVVCE